MGVAGDLPYLAQAPRAKPNFPSLPRPSAMGTPTGEGGQVTISILTAEHAEAPQRQQARLDLSARSALSVVRVAQPGARIYPPPGTWTTASTSTNTSGRTRAATKTVELAGGSLGKVSARTLL